MFEMDLLNILSIVSFLLTLFLVYKTIIVLRGNINPGKGNPDFQVENTEYEKIVRSTYRLENERQKNKGVTIEENVFINRAETMREKTRFFDWVNALE